MGLVLEEMVRLRDTMMSLNLNPEKAMQLSKSVEAVERKIDFEHRNLDLEILAVSPPFNLCFSSEISSNTSKEWPTLGLT